MAKVRIELDTKAVGALLRGPEVQAMLESQGAAVSKNAGTGYSSRTHNTGQRHICNVYAATQEARQDNAQNNTLLKALVSLPERSK